MPLIQNANQPGNRTNTVQRRQSKDVVAFGPFTLVASERLLTKDGKPVVLGARALDLLIALVSRPDQAVSKRDLIAKVWPDVTVGEGSLRFHIAHLRKALGDGESGARYITTLAGRGYYFVAPITRSSGRADAPIAPPPRFQRANMPSRLTRMVGRANAVATLSTEVLAVRFVTIVGAGGVGKTTLAVAVGNHLIETFAGTVLFVDFGALSDPRLAVTSVASMLGLPVHSEDPTADLTAYLQDKRLLLILDNCEHVIEAAAALAAGVFAAALQVHILTTSREALRVEGEHVYRLTPLPFPPKEAGITAAVALTYPAIQLFVERAAASGAPIELSDSNAAIVAGICRRLDGVALAIELAAARVETYGLEQTASLLEKRLSLLWLGQRTAPPRQQTLKATLDWSYELLSRLEQQVLLQLSVFVGDFTLGSALAVLASPTLDQMLVLGAVESLVAKSMVAINPTGKTMRYRLLDTTRDYLLEIRIGGAEFAELAARHAAHYRHWLEETAAELPTVPNEAERASYIAELGNIRAALEWCFGDNGDIASGIGLAAAAAPVFMAMSLIAECRRWSDCAILALDDTSRGGRDEMHLQSALAMSTMFSRGSTDAVRTALYRSLQIAEQRNDPRAQLRLLSTLHMFYGRVGDPRAALRHARRSVAVAEIIEDPAAAALAHSLVGMSLHRAGELSGAREELEAALRHAPPSPLTSATYLGFNGHCVAAIGLARILWLQGYPAQAQALAHQTVTSAVRIDHPVTLSVVLIWAISVFLWAGDLESAEDHIDWFISRAESHSLAPYVAVGRGFQGELAVRRGNAVSGIQPLQACLQELHAARYELLTTPFNISLALGLAATGRCAEGIALIDETIRLAEADGDVLYMAELLRVRGNVLLLGLQSNDEEAEKCFMQSLSWSRRQAASAWELRATVDLAGLWAARGQRESAKALLQPVFERFVEGFNTTDLKSAESMLAALS